MKLDGKLISLKLKDELKLEVEKLKEEGKRTPCLAVVMVGDDHASSVYVRNKQKVCEYIGIESRAYLYEELSEDKLLELIDSLNKDHDVDGILIELPLPKYIDEAKVLTAIDSRKDVDGFHPDNIARLFLGEKGLVPCTPAGMMKLLDEIGYDLTGKEVVVIGRSNIVGKPVALLALNKHATVTICHSRTKDLKTVCKRADVLISAVGKAKMIDASYVKEGAVILDVGINRDENGKLCGDVDYADCEKVASYITPVPGGVGAMTVTMLMQNTLNAYRMKGE